MQSDDSALAAFSSFLTIFIGANLIDSLSHTHKHANGARFMLFSQFLDFSLEWDMTKLAARTIYFCTMGKPKHTFPQLSNAFRGFLSSIPRNIVSRLGLAASAIYRAMERTVNRRKKSTDFGLISENSIAQSVAPFLSRSNYFAECLHTSALVAHQPLSQSDESECRIGCFSCVFT